MSEQLAEQADVATKGTLRIGSGRRRHGHPLILGGMARVPVLFVSLMSRYERARTGTCAATKEPA
ncbi:hypothetical protein TBR22_A20460 [Luteitalea sp. TBR-22]|nr:hypothetical protein TBR22_A20460 [Luteitalea sp. TBR-22]